jgi:hypothetical protein
MICRFTARGRTSAHLTYLPPNRDSADGALSVSKARKKIRLARSTVTSTWRSAELRIKLRSVSFHIFPKKLEPFYRTSCGCEIGLRGDLVGDVQELPLLLENPEKFT